MASIAFRLLVGFAAAYLATLAILFVFQSRFIYPAPQTPAPLTPGYQEVQLETGDGLRLRAFHREATAGMPTILYFHGNGGTLAGASVSNGAIVEAGMGALLVEYRGYGGNSGSPSEAGLYADGLAAARWLVDQGVSADQTVVVGNSIGTGVASYIATDRDTGLEQPAALILIAPFTSLPAAAGDKLWWLPARMLVKDQYDTRARISQADLPILIQHGTADTLIGDHHGRALAQVAPDAQFQPFDGSGHALSFERRSQEARRDWLLDLFQDRQKAD